MSRFRSHFTEAKAEVQGSFRKFQRLRNSPKVSVANRQKGFVPRLACSGACSSPGTLLLKRRATPGHMREGEREQNSRAVPVGRRPGSRPALGSSRANK